VASGPPAHEVSVCMSRCFVRFVEPCHHFAAVTGVPSRSYHIAIAYGSLLGSEDQRTLLVLLYDGVDMLQHPSAKMTWRWAIFDTPRPKSARLLRTLRLDGGPSDGLCYSFIRKINA
jgi:hypothetical protein